MQRVRRGLDVASLTCMYMQIDCMVLECRSKNTRVLCDMVVMCGMNVLGGVVALIGSREDGASG
jgi:hypothetical protein